MIEAKLLQSFMSDIEWLRKLSNSSATGSTSSSGAKSAPYDPFTEILAKTIGLLEENQLQDNAPLGTINPGFQLGMEMLNTWLNPGSNRSSSVTKDDIDKLFPDLANLNSMLESQINTES